MCAAGICICFLLPHHNKSMPFKRRCIYSFATQHHTFFPDTDVMDNLLDVDAISMMCPAGIYLLYLQNIFVFFHQARSCTELTNTVSAGPMTMTITESIQLRQMKLTPRAIPELIKHTVKF